MTTSMKWTTRSAALAFGLATLAGAAGAQNAKRLPPVTATDSLNNSVTVQNDRKEPVTVYMEYGEFDRRLGIVGPYATATLPLPQWAVRGHQVIQLFAHPDGAAEDLASERFALTPPARLAMLVPPLGGVPEPAFTMTAVIPPEELADATLTVENPRAVAVTVFAEEGFFDARLGRVPAHGTATLRFPKSAVRPDQSIQIFVHPDRGMDLASEDLQLKPGAHLGLRVPPK